MVSLRRGFRTGRVASTEPGGKGMSRLIRGDCTGGGTMWDAGTGGPAFCIFIPCIKGDLLGDVLLSMGRGMDAGLGTCGMWFCTP